MKVLEAEKVMMVLEKMKKYMPRTFQGRLLGPDKYMTCRNIDMIIERLEKEVFEVDIPGDKKE